MKQLLELFLDGLDKPLAYFPESALAGVEANFSRGSWTPDDEKMLSKMEARFIGGYMQTGEGENPYISRVWSEWDDGLANELKLVTQLVLEAPRTVSVDAEEFYSQG